MLEIEVITRGLCLTALR